MTDSSTNQAAQNWVYVIGSAEHHRVKIGTAADVPARRSQLQTGAPFRLDILMTLRGDAAFERRLHHHLAAFRVVGEWFDFGNADPVTSIREAVEAIGREGGAYELWRERRKEARRQRSALRYVR